MEKPDPDSRERTSCTSRYSRRDSRANGRFPRAAATWLAITCVGATLVMGFVLRTRQPSPIRSDSETAIPAEYESYAVACLVQGEVSPKIDGLAPNELDSIVAILALVLHTYEQADFESFLKWHEPDLRSAGITRAGDIQRIHEYTLELKPGADVPDDWIGALAAFWTAYYEVPPVARFIPETTRLRLTRGHFVAESWNRSFDTFRDENSRNHIAHHLVIPHRRPPQDAANETDELVWMDLAIDFETPHGISARLIARFVWDALDEAWFLQRAATANLHASGNVSERRHLIL